MHQSSEVAVEEVHESHTDTRAVREHLFGSHGGLDASQWALVRVQRIQNRPLRAAYQLERQHLLRERGEESLNERLLTHACDHRQHYSAMSVD